MPPSAGLFAAVLLVELVTGRMVLLQVLDVLAFILLRDFLAVCLSVASILMPWAGSSLIFTVLPSSLAVISFTPLTFLTLMVRMAAPPPMFSCPPLMMICPPKPLPGPTIPAGICAGVVLKPFFLSKIDLAFRAAAGLSPSARRCKASAAALPVVSSEDFSSLPRTVAARLDTSRLPVAAAFSRAGIADFPLGRQLAAGILALGELG